MQVTDGYDVPQQAVDAVERLEQEGKTTIVVAYDGRVIGAPRAGRRAAARR